MSGIIRLIFRNEIKREIKDVPKDASKIDATVELIFEKNHWKPGLFENIKKKAIKSVLKDSITQEKADHLPPLLSRVERKIKARGINVLTPDAIESLCHELQEKEPAFTLYEIRYILKTHVQIRKVLAKKGLALDGNYYAYGTNARDQLKVFKGLHAEAKAEQKNLRRNLRVVQKRIAVSLNISEETIDRELYSLCGKDPGGLSTQEIRTTLDSISPELRVSKLKIMMAFADLMDLADTITPKEAALLSAMLDNNNHASLIQNRKVNGRVLDRLSAIYKAAHTLKEILLAQDGLSDFNSDRKNTLLEKWSEKFQDLGLENVITADGLDNHTAFNRISVLYVVNIIEHNPRDTRNMSPSELRTYIDRKHNFHTVSLECISHALVYNDPVATILQGFRGVDELTLEQCEQFLSAVSAHYNGHGTRAVDKSKKKNPLKELFDADLKKEDSKIIEVIRRRLQLKLNEETDLETVYANVLQKINRAIQADAASENISLQQAVAQHKLKFPSQNLETIRLNGSPRTDFNRPPCPIEYCTEGGVVLSIPAGNGRSFQEAPLPDCIPVEGLTIEAEIIASALNASHFLINSFGIKMEAFEVFSYLIVPQAGITFLLDILTKAEDNQDTNILTTSECTGMKITKIDANSYRIDLDVTLRVNLPNLFLEPTAIKPFERLLPLGKISFIFDQSNPTSPQIRDMNRKFTTSSEEGSHEQFHTNDPDLTVPTSRDSDNEAQRSIPRKRKVRKTETKNDLE